MTEDISGEKIVISKVLLQNENGEFLAVRERSNRDKETAGKWELPGGRIKFGEDRFEAAMRELKEEVGLEVDPEEGEDVVRIEVESDHLVSCYIVYFDSFEGEPKIKEESHHSEYRWVTADEFLKMDWHSDAGYDIVPMKHLQEYLDKEKIY